MNNIKTVLFQSYNILAKANLYGRNQLTSGCQN